MSEMGGTASTGTLGEVIPFLGVDFDYMSEDETLRWVERQLARPGFSYVVTPNVDHVVRLHKKGRVADVFDEAYDKADLLVCDSRVLSRLAKFSNLRLGVVPGSDLTATMVTRGGRWNRVAVVGGNREVWDVLARDYPQYDWVFHEPPFGVLHNADARQEIRRFVEEADADIVFFAIGAPQSELCCLEIKKAGKARGVALCTGASLEFLAGIKSRAPHWLQRLGMEWIYRLSCEPTRLWRRYLVEGPKILLIWLRWKP
ncbi:MAG: WecB/TagA/CpsF family glycosyltransferase [Erythrobacter sp.]|jgi:exopolysaccharide biosynthesis WecB/TagA/CpsF family protein|nr:WecB/TagA/CpsF family glycosyltransferase [Erythrobacter sp.]